jgi:UDP-N-acetylmuramoyl-L-alanyl-D-glutamate--2,6-diaminopimelate ligase
MKLADLCAGAPVRAIEGDGGTEVSDLAYDSRQVVPGSLFFCVRGASSDGHDFAAGAVEAGAAALVVERPLELPVPQILTEDARAAMAPIAARFFRYPTAELKLAGVTGTNGKTTTAFLVRRVLEANGSQCGLLGTVKRIVGGAEQKAVRTTPEAVDLQRTFRQMLDEGDVACAMEISSHALVLGRADEITVAAAAFTNLTQDHLDFHSDMEDYYAAKRSLFTGVGGRREPPAVSAINVDDGYGRRLVAELEGVPTELLTFSAGGREADLRAEGVRFDAAGTRFTLLTAGREIAVELPLPGHFNVENALAAVALAIGLGIDPAAAAAALRDAEAVPGRLEPIAEGQPFAVLVDYAHTPDSLDNVLAAARKLTAGRLITVFGCGGDRDRAKRPLMGASAASRSDLAVVTSDNPRSERPAAILDDILEGIDDRSGVKVEEDRRAAIALALGEAEADDLVLIAGKGHEQGQEFEGGRKIPFDDRDVAREELRRLAAAA